MEEALVLLLLLTVGLAVLVFRRRVRAAAPAPTRRRQRTIVVSDPGIAKLTLIEHADAFSTRPTGNFPKAKGRFSGNQSINSVPLGPLWRALRCNLVSGVLHPTRLHLVAPLEQEAAEAIVADLSARGAAAVVVRDSLHAAVFALTARLCFGDGVGAERYVRAMERQLLQFVFTFGQDSAFFAGGGSSSWMTLATRLWHWRRWLRYSGTSDRGYSIVRPIIVAARRRKQQQQQPRRRRTTTTGIRSYVDLLLDLRVPDDDSRPSSAAASTTTTTKQRPLTDKEIARFAFEFLGANTESVVACVEWTLARLVLQPEVQRKMHREITAHDNQQGNRKGSEEARLLHHRLPYLRAVMLESLRLHPPVPIVRAVSAKDAEIITAATAAPAAADSSSSLPATLTVITDIHKIGRNGKVWTDPDEFRPERFLAGGEAAHVGPVPGPKEIRMLPFGAGPRYCPGVGLAMLRVGCILAALVRQFRWELPPDSDGGVDLKELRGFFTTMKTPLRAHITPRAFTT